MHSALRHIWAPCLFALAMSGCGGSSTEKSSAPAPSAHGQAESPRLELTRDSAGTVLLQYGGGKARMAEVRLKWSGTWTLANHEAGEAATAAEKDVRVIPIGSNEARLLVYSAGNTNTIGSGTLAKLTLKGGSGGSIDIVSSPPMLAPAEAEQGLRIGDPLSL